MSGMSEIHILYVDDDLDLADLAADVLEREDGRFTVETATSASDGLDRLADTDFDCVVSEYQMPGQNGIEFLERVRGEYPALPFILYTARGSEAVASKAISAGVTDYLEKNGSAEAYESLANRIQTVVDRHQARTAATQTDQRIQTIAEHSNDVLWKFTADWSELRFINSAYETIWGRSIDELRDHPQSFLEGVHPDDRPAVEDAIDQLSVGESVDIEYRVNAEEDYGRWVWVQSEPVFDDAGEVVEVVGFARDITDRKQREHELTRYQTIVETSGDPVYTLDAEGCFTFVNDAFTEFMGYEANAVLGDHASTVMTEEHVERGEALIQTLLASDRNEGTFEMDVLTARGERIPCENHIGLLRSGDEFHGTVGVLRDLTERKERERKLERQNERLTEFASVVSHDLRNPLNVAQGHLELARDEFESEHIGEAAEAVDRSLRLIDDLLTLAREGDKVSETEPVDLAELIEGCWRTVETADATLVSEAGQTIQADSSRLKQLLENLFRNAVEHGGDDVTVTVGNLDDSDGFYVADDGPGISDTERDEVFETGYSTAADGTGFGLNIVQEIAEAHGWTITITDSETGGARFEITGVGSVGG